jgi:hypothetical protein
LVQLGQAPKNGGPVLRVIVRDNLTGRLVIRDHAGGRRVDPHANRLAVDLDRVAKLDALTDVRRFGIDRNSTFQNELLHFKARTQTGLRQHLVQLRAFRLRRQHSLGQDDGDIFFVCVELAGHHIFKLVSSVAACGWLLPVRLCWLYGALLLWQDGVNNRRRWRVGGGNWGV